MKALMQTMGLIVTLMLFVVTVLDLLKDHLGIDTKAMLLGFGNIIGKGAYAIYSPLSDLISLIPYSEEIYIKAVVMTIYSVALAYQVYVYQIKS